MLPWSPRSCPFYTVFFTQFWNKKNEFRINKRPLYLLGPCSLHVSYIFISFFCALKVRHGPFYYYVLKRGRWHFSELESFTSVLCLWKDFFSPITFGLLCINVVSLLSLCANFFFWLLPNSPHATYPHLSPLWLHSNFPLNGHTRRVRSG